MLLMIIYTAQQMEIIHNIKTLKNTILSSAHGTGKSLIFNNLSKAPHHLYYSVGTSDINLRDHARQYNQLPTAHTKHKTLFLDNVLVTDIHAFKFNYNSLAARLKNIHAIIYLKDIPDKLKYFPDPSITSLTKYFGNPAQLALLNKADGEFKPICQTITQYMKPNTPVNYAHQDHCSLDRHDKARGLGIPKLSREQAKVDP